MIIAVTFLVCRRLRELRNGPGEDDVLRLPDGTNLQVRLTERLDSDTNQTAIRFKRSQTRMSWLQAESKSLPGAGSPAIWSKFGMRGR